MRDTIIYGKPKQATPRHTVSEMGGNGPMRAASPGATKAASLRSALPALLANDVNERQARFRTRRCWTWPLHSNGAIHATQAQLFPRCFLLDFSNAAWRKRSCRLSSQPRFFLAEPSVNLKRLLLAQFFPNV